MIERIFQATGKQKKSKVTILISHKRVFKQKNGQKEKESHYIIIKGSRRCNIINIHAPRFGAPKYIQQMLKELKGEINSNTMILRYFDTLIYMNRSMHRINKKTADFQKTINEVILRDIYRTFHPISGGYTFFKAHIILFLR